MLSLSILRGIFYFFSFLYMKLLTSELLRKFNQIGSQEYIPNPIVIAKFFHPASRFIWLATEFLPETQVFFGYVIWHDEEWWYFSLEELVSFRDKYGLAIERDMYAGYQCISEHLKTLGCANF